MSLAPLIDKYIEPSDSPADAWIRGYGVPVWALVSYLRAVWERSRACGA